MFSLKELERHKTNIKIFRAYSVLELAKQSILFPCDYYLRKGKAGHPLNIAFFVTLRCNASCEICKLSDILNEKEEKEPSLEDIDKFLSGIKYMKPSIILYGGEPFVRKDIVEIVALVKSRGFRCGIFTNGILLNEEIINKLVALKLDFIVFSIQGTAQTHDSIVGVKGAFEKLLRNVALFAKQKKYTKIIAQIMITEENLGELSELSSLLKEEGADLIRIGHPTFLSASDVDKNKKICEKHFPGEDISGMSYISDTGERSDRYFNAIKELKNKFNHNLAFLPNLGDSEIRDWYSKDFKTHRKCLFLWRATFIHPNGDVHPCESLKYPIGNIYKEEFDKIWNGKKYIKLRKLLKKGLLPACTRCCKL